MEECEDLHFRKMLWNTTVSVLFETLLEQSIPAPDILIHNPPEMICIFLVFGWPLVDVRFKRYRLYFTAFSRREITEWFSMLNPTENNSITAIWFKYSHGSFTGSKSSDPSAPKKVVRLLLCWAGREMPRNDFQPYGLMLLCCIIIIAFISVCRQ